MEKQMEISFDKSLTAEQVRRSVLRLAGVTSCELVCEQTVCVAYDESQIVAKLIVKAAGYRKGAKRRNNITKIRELQHQLNTEKIQTR